MRAPAMQFAAAEPLLNRTRLRLRFPCRRPYGSYPQTGFAEIRHQGIHQHLTSPKPTSGPPGSTWLNLWLVRYPPGIEAKGLSTLPAALNAVVGNNPCYLATNTQVHKLTRACPLLIRVIQH